MKYKPLWYPHSSILLPNVHFRRWQQTEDATLSIQYDKLGPSWGIISKYLPGRTPSDCRKHWIKANTLTLYTTTTIPSDPNGKKDAIRKAGIQEATKKAIEYGLQHSEFFPPPVRLKYSSKKASIESSLVQSGYENLTGKWIRIPEDPRPTDPYAIISSDLPRHLKRSQIIKNGWSELEDLVLREAFETLGNDWISIHYALPKRTWQECRLRLSLHSAIWNPIANE